MAPDSMKWRHSKYVVFIGISFNGISAAAAGLLYVGVSMGVA